jgi:hypothetical protein
MKNSFFLFLCALIFSVSVNAQSTADSISAKYKLLPMPEAFTVEKAFPAVGVYTLATTADAAAATEATATTEVRVSLDSASKGIVWVEGLPQGKFKAYLKQSPSTYRIIPQKTESGTQISEGTLIFDPSTNVLQIALGKAFDEANPAGVFAMNTTGASEMETEVKVKTKKSKTKSKARIQYYTANKTASVQKDATSSL